MEEEEHECRYQIGDCLCIICGTPFCDISYPCCERRRETCLKHLFAKIIRRKRIGEA